MSPEEFGIHTPTPDEAHADAQSHFSTPLEGSETSHSQRPPTHDAPNDADNDDVMFPWWPTQASPCCAFHANTRLPDGRSSIIIDTGAWGNLCGGNWAEQAAIQSKAAGHPATESLMDQPMHVQGVGNGSQRCDWQVTIPIATRMEDGRYQLNQFRAPTVPKSDLPALLGLRSLMAQGAIIDCRRRK